MMRLCDSAVLCSLSTASVAMATALSKPKVTSVPPKSLSMVFGMPTTGSWYSACSRAAALSVPSPPMATTASSPWATRLRTTVSGPPGTKKGLTRLVPRMVPPR